MNHPVSPRITFLLAFVFCTLLSGAQNMARLSGVVTDLNNRPIELVNVAIPGQPGGTATDRRGRYELLVPAEKNITIAFSFVGYGNFSKEMSLRTGERKTLNVTLESTSTILPDITIEDTRIRTTTLTRIDPKASSNIPSLTGSAIESLVKTMPGVASNNELSSQYSVRGGNYDENLVYVNDVEIYRPFLVRSGQQEGLSFLNSDLVSSILFSAGGFEARYGDKMSSVLDIRYRKPVEFGGSASVSLLGANVHLEGISPDSRWTYLLGIRQKSNQYLLGSLETKGDYKPSFTDIQGALNFDIDEKWEISFLGNFSRNAYTLIPSDRETDFGTIQEAYRLKIYFDGQEVDRFINFMGALTLAWKPRPMSRYSLTASAFHTDERETYDIQGQYWIGKLETDLGSDDFGTVTEAQGIGTYLNHARNRLVADVINLEHRGNLTHGLHFFQWGLKWQHERIDDKISEWTMIDSAGYSLPVAPDSIGYTNPLNQPDLPFTITEVFRSTNNVISNRFTAFAQDNWELGDSSNQHLTVGIRAHYWELNNQLLISPRATFSVKPKWKNDVVLRLSGGLYYQPPFYRELRDRDGTINTNVKAQQSIQIVTGADYNFKAWSRPFKLTAELYYKFLDNLIPYEVDNVRIRYLPSQVASGYATGIDLKVNGEFVKGAESWVSLSLMKTEEDIKDDFYYKYLNQAGNEIIAGYTTDNVVTDSVLMNPGYIPRPTDQRFTFNLFFQDFLPGNPTYKMHLNLVFGSSLPFGAPSAPKYLHTLRIPPYRRVDIGFSKMIKGENNPGKGFLRHFKDVWITAEVFNLLQFNNTVSYLWVTDVNNRRYPIPNHLTPRQINIKLAARF